MTTRTIRIFALFLVCLAFRGAVTAVSAQNAAARPSPAPAGSTYLIQPNDLLEIFVLEEPTWSRKVVVAPDGWVSVPNAQDIKAAGLTTGQLKLEIEKKLADVKKLPTVTVMLEAIQSYKIYVTGKVQKGGVFQSEKPISVFQAISMAGGLSDYAKKDEIVIIRSVGQGGTRFPFNYTEVYEGKKLNQNILLEPGDVVVVP